MIFISLIDFLLEENVTLDWMVGFESLIFEVLRLIGGVCKVAFIVSVVDKLELVDNDARVVTVPLATKTKMRFRVKI